MYILINACIGIIHIFEIMDIYEFVWTLYSSIQQYMYNRYVWMYVSVCRCIEYDFVQELF